MACVSKKDLPSWASEHFLSQCCDDDTSLLKNWKLSEDNHSCVGDFDNLRPRDIEKIIEALPMVEEEDKECQNERLNPIRKPKKVAEIKDKISDLSSKNECLQTDIKIKGEENRQISRAIENVICILSKLDENQGKLTQQFMCEKQSFDDALQAFLVDFNCHEETAYKVHDLSLETIYKRNFLASLKLEEDRLDKALLKRKSNLQKNEINQQIRQLQNELTSQENKLDNITHDVLQLKQTVDEKEIRLLETKEDQTLACECKIETQKKKLKLEQELEEICCDLNEQNNSIKALKYSIGEGIIAFSGLKDSAMEASCCLDSLSKEICRKQSEHDSLQESVCRSEHIIRDFASSIAKNEASIEAFEKLKQQLQCQIEEEKKKTTDLARRIKEYEELLTQIRQKQNTMEKQEIKKQDLLKKC